LQHRLEHQQLELGFVSSHETYGSLYRRASDQRTANESKCSHGAFCLSATYAVIASGPSLLYQWSKNGAAIARATSMSYSTPVFSGTGASFTVTIENSAGKLTSETALLTVTARAPLAGDLRFQQVDAASTVTGWGNAGPALISTQAAQREI
jgi:hypothetical protein